MLVNKKIHCVGIKGVGMTPVAIMLQELGNQITGSDTDVPQITDSILAKKKIPVKIFNQSNITSEVDLVIYSGAYKLSKHPELKKATELDIPCVSQAHVLAEIVNQKDHVAICGVGGKTTTSGMGAVICQALGYGGWFVGVSQVNRNLPGGHIDQSDLMIVEADEYAIAPPRDNRPKFALYNPKVIICTNIAHDHPDIYEDLEHTLDTFANFFNRLPLDGALIIKPRDLHLLESRLKTEARIITYGSEPTVDWCLRQSSMPLLYNVISKDQEYSLNMSVIGQMNAENATALLAAADFLHLDLKIVLEGITAFKGTKRRLEKIKESSGILYMDDYGHHPDEIKLTLAAIKNQYPDKRLVVIFHPHTLSRTKALLSDFGNSFAAADKIMLAPIFASAREEDDESITSDDLANVINKNNSDVEAFTSFGEIIEKVNTIKKSGDIILTLGAGDIYKIHREL